MVTQTVKNLPTMQETRVRSLGWEDPLESGIATCFSITAWRIPWTEEPDSLQSIGLHRVGHNGSNLACPHTCRTPECFSYIFPGGSDGKESACNAGDPVQSLGREDSHRGGNGNPPQYSCLENPMDRGAWWATVHGVTNKSESDINTAVI